MKFADRVSELQGSAIREMFKLLGDPQMISFAGGAPSPELFPSDALAEISKEIIKNHPAIALQYGVTEGYAPLAEQIDAVVAVLHRRVPVEHLEDVPVLVGADRAADVLIGRIRKDRPVGLPPCVYVAHVSVLVPDASVFDDDHAVRRIS